jgi:hypothetical protein
MRFVALTPGGPEPLEHTMVVQLSQVLAIETFPNTPESPTLDLQLSAVLHLPDGLVYSGTLVAAAPNEHSRLSDILNMSDDFIRMRCEAKVAWLRRSQVLYAREADRPA